MQKPTHLREENYSALKINKSMLNFDYQIFYKDQLSNILSDANMLHQKSNKNEPTTSSYQRVVTFYYKNKDEGISKTLERVRKYSTINNEQLHLKYDFDHENEGVFIIIEGKCIVINRRDNINLNLKPKIKNLKIAKAGEYDVFCGSFRSKVCDLTTSDAFGYGRALSKNFSE